MKSAPLLLTIVCVLWLAVMVSGNSPEKFRPLQTDYIVSDAGRLEVWSWSNTKSGSLRLEIRDKLTNRVKRVFLFEPPKITSE